MTIQLEKYICVCHKCKDYIALYAGSVEEMPENIVCDCGDERYSVPTGEKFSGMIT